MISGLGISSGIASAVRTAGRARATMDDMSRQIATGQRVSSVKDDGAAWARANALKSQQAEIDGRKVVSGFLNVAIEEQGSETLATVDAINAVKDILVAALTYQTGSGGRANLKAELASQVAVFDSPDRTTGPIVTGYALQADGRFGIATSSADSVFGGRTIFASPGYANAWTSWASVSVSGTTLRTIDLATASNATIQSMISWLDSSFRPSVYSQEAQASGDRAYLESVTERDDKAYDRLDTAIGSLTDADLGKVSTARAQAESRQQFALETIKTALTAYGNYAGGLLGNVQRTQRGVLA